MIGSSAFDLWSLQWRPPDSADTQLDSCILSLRLYFLRLLCNFSNCGQNLFLMDSKDMLWSLLRPPLSQLDPEVTVAGSSWAATPRHHPHLALTPDTMQGVVGARVGWGADTGGSCEAHALHPNKSFKKQTGGVGFPVGESKCDIPQVYLLKCI